MKKTLKDLKIGSSVYRVSGSYIRQMKVVSIIFNRDAKYEVKLDSGRTTASFDYDENLDVLPSTYSLEAFYLNMNDAVSHVKGFLHGKMIRIAEDIQKSLNALEEVRKELESYG